ncbi:hypothetical protein EGT74_00770 [Chitinophaga lutea]|uniref:Uncharacterized protein n=1 Tax=Chitinophaga lutea TaxID=2488634 RepID=A0A3N4QK27_9BACT|nr:tetratricopeptide repeat protein [Chitinophaga lutea]RPE12124.1 hypothetical protein EGT74_00770 [Chitinophaga lutea]
MNLYRILNLCLIAPVCTAHAAPAEPPAGIFFVKDGQSRGALALPETAGHCATLHDMAPSFSSAATAGDPARTAYRKGLRMQRSGRLDEAQQYFEAAIRKNSLFRNAYIALADIHRLQQAPEPAKQLLQRLLKLSPEHGAAWEMLSAIHYGQQAWEDALTCAFRAQELGVPHMHRLIGLSYAALNHPAEAAQALEKARGEGMLNGEDLCRAARISAQLEAFEKSVQYYEESLKAGGNPPAVYYELGMMYFNMKNYKQAAGAFEQATRSGRPADADLYLNLGMAYLKQAAYDDAISNLQTASSLRPKDIQVMLNLANAYYKKQDFKLAAIQWNKILVMQPQNAFAMFMLGKSYMGYGELLKGQAICDQALAMGEK